MQGSISKLEVEFIILYEKINRNLVQDYLNIAEMLPFQRICKFECSHIIPGFYLQAAQKVVDFRSTVQIGMTCIRILQE